MQPRKLVIDTGALHTLYKIGGTYLLNSIGNSEIKIVITEGVFNEVDILGHVDKLLSQYQAAAT